MWARPSLKLGSFWKLRVSANTMGGTIGDESDPGRGGVGIVPSTPTRKLANPGLPLEPTPADALQPLTLAPFALHNGAWRLMVCAKPTPSMGMITLCTVLTRS